MPSASFPAPEAGEAHPHVTGEPAQVPVWAGYGPYGASGVQSPPAGTSAGPPTAPAPSEGGGGKRPGTGRLAAVVAAVLVAGLLGGVVGAVVTKRTSRTTDQTPATPAYSAETIRTQNVQLCTSYAIINSAMPKPADNALQILPGANGLRLALDEAPAASSEIRSAISHVVSEFDALIASFGKVRTRGMAKPPTYHVAKAQAVFDRAWDICQLG